MYPPVRQFEERPYRARRSIRWIAVAVAAVAIAAASYAAAANAATAAAGCTAGTTTVGGSPARTFCGPATAAVTFGGKTFHFANGACTTGPGFAVNVGTLVIGSTTKARPYFGFFLTSARPGTHSGKEAAVSFASGPIHVSLAPNAASHVVLNRGLRSGSFAGKDLLGRALTGSFHC